MRAFLGFKQILINFCVRTLIFFFFFALEMVHVLQVVPMASFGLQSVHANGWQFCTSDNSIETVAISGLFKQL